MCKNSLSSNLFDYLSDHVKEVKKEVNSLIKEYYSENTPESLDIERFFKEYADTLISYLSIKRTTADGSMNCPFVIIRSIVEVQDMDDMGTYRFYIVPPYSTDSFTTANNASCLSPLGRALLLKSIDQQVQVEIPSGTLRYCIKNITVPKQLISKYQNEPEPAIQ